MLEVIFVVANMSPNIQLLIMLGATFLTFCSWVKKLEYNLRQIILKILFLGHPVFIIQYTTTTGVHTTQYPQTLSTLISYCFDQGCKYSKTGYSIWMRSNELEMSSL